MDEMLTLPTRLDSAAVPAVATAIQAKSGHPLTIDAGQVEFAGALGMQMLVAANRQWREAGLSFQVTGAEPVLFELCRALGVEPDEIGAADAGGIAA